MKRVKPEVLAEHQQKKPTERDSIIDTGQYNSYIAGYMALALEGIKKKPTEIEIALDALDATLALYTAKKARERGQR